MSSKIAIVGLSSARFGRNFKVLGQYLSKYDVFIYGGAYSGCGSRISNRLRKADFSTYLWMQYGTLDKRQQRRALNAFEHSASCAILFGPDARSQLTDEWLRAAIRDRVQRTRGEYRVIPVLLPGASKRLTMSLLDEVCGFETKWPVFFREGDGEKESLHQLILAMRGVEPELPADWQMGWFRKYVRWRAKNALNVDWPKLGCGVRNRIADMATGEPKMRLVSDCEDASPTLIPEDYDVQRESYRRWFSPDAATERLPAPLNVLMLNAHALPIHYAKFSHQQPCVSRSALDNLSSSSFVFATKLVLLNACDSVRQLDDRTARHSAGVFHTLKECAVRLLHKFSFSRRTELASLEFPYSERKASVSLYEGVFGFPYSERNAWVSLYGSVCSEASAGKTIRFHQKSPGVGESGFAFQLDFELAHKAKLKREARRRAEVICIFPSVARRASASCSFEPRAESVISVKPSGEGVFAARFKRLWEAGDNDLWKAHNDAEIPTLSGSGVIVFGQSPSHELPGDNCLLAVSLFDAGGARLDERVDAIRNREFYEAAARMFDMECSRVFVFTDEWDSDNRDLIAGRFGCKFVRLRVMDRRAVKEGGVWNHNSFDAYRPPLATRSRYYRLRTDAGARHQPQLWTPAETRGEECGQSEEKHSSEDAEGFDSRMHQMPKVAFFFCTGQPLT